MTQESLTAKIIAEGELVLDAPLLIGSGGGEEGNQIDIHVLRDKDGIPYIPGTSLAGVLRAFVEADDAKTGALIFGTLQDSHGKAALELQSAISLYDVRLSDATQSDWWDGRLFDCILADVPCSASGIIRRHPDIRWLRQPDDGKRLAALSAAILDNLWKKLRKGGKLLFATCSIWPEESIGQADFFAFRSDAKRLDAFGQLLPTFNGLNDHDGLFYGLFQKIG